MTLLLEYSMTSKTRKIRTFRRKLFSEKLEGRAMMASDVMHNFIFPHDVDDDGSVTPLDALIVINHLNRGGADDSVSSARQFHDVDDDSKLSPLDALALINDLNSKSLGSNNVSTAVSQSSSMNRSTIGSRVRVELETEGGETELKIRIDNAPSSKSLGVSLNNIALGQLTTDAHGRGQIVLSRGDDNRSHLALPDALTTLSPDMELVIGEIVKGRLSQVTKVEGGGGTTTTIQGEYFNAKFAVVGGVSRSASYEQETERGVTKRKFEAEIEKAAVNSTIEVTVAGVVVGNITTDSKGKGKLRLTTTVKDARDQLMPASFPAITEGTVVKIGSVQSVLIRVP
jgi:hypothetical protein